MDPVSIANSLLVLITPMVAKGVGELANTALKDVYATIKERLSKKPDGKSVVDAFEKNPSQGAEAFQAALVEQLRVDQELVRQLVDALNASKDNGSLVGEVNAKNVVISNKIDNINMS